MSSAAVTSRNAFSSRATPRSSSTCARPDVRRSRAAEGSSTSCAQCMHDRIATARAPRAPNGWIMNLSTTATKRFGRLARISAKRCSMVLKPVAMHHSTSGEIGLLAALVLPAFEHGRQQIELGEDVAEPRRQHLLALQRAAERQKRHVGAKREGRRVARELAIERVASPASAGAGANMPPVQLGPTRGTGS